MPVCPAGNSLLPQYHLRSAWSLFSANGHRPVLLCAISPRLRKTCLRQSKRLRPAPSTEPSHNAIQLASGVAEFREASPASAHAPLSAAAPRRTRLIYFKSLEPGTYTKNHFHHPARFQVHHEASVTSPPNSNSFRMLLSNVNGLPKVEVKRPPPLLYGNHAAPAASHGYNAEIISIHTAEKVKDILPFTPGVIKTLDSKTDFQRAATKIRACCWSFRATTIR